MKGKLVSFVIFSGGFSVSRFSISKYAKYDRESLEKSQTEQDTISVLRHPLSYWIARNCINRIM